jgi:DNA-damage-inducible protein J
MATQTERVNFRIEPELKQSVEEILAKIGMTSAEACRIFFAQILINQGLPFQPKAKIKNIDDLDKDVKDKIIKRSVDKHILVLKDLFNR